LSESGQTDTFIDTGNIVPVRGSKRSTLMGVEDLGRQVERRRRELDLTQPALAALASCSERFIRELEAGKPSVRLDKLNAVLQVLGLDLRAVPRRPT
jgi:HTH-type transcriptional regulator/antitoxin HipB